MHNVTDLNKLIVILEQAKELQAIHGNMPVSVQAFRETGGNPWGFYYEELECAPELKLEDTDANKDSPVVVLYV